MLIKLTNKGSSNINHLFCQMRFYHRFLIHGKIPFRPVQALYKSFACCLVMPRS